MTSGANSVKAKQPRGDLVGRDCRAHWSKVALTASRSRSGPPPRVQVPEDQLRDRRPGGPQHGGHGSAFSPGERRWCPTVKIGWNPARRCRLSASRARRPTRSKGRMDLSWRPPRWRPVFLSRAAAIARPLNPSPKPPTPACMASFRLDFALRRELAFWPVERESPRRNPAGGHDAG